MNRSIAKRLLSFSVAVFFGLSQGLTGFAANITEDAAADDSSLLASEESSLLSSDEGTIESSDVEEDADIEQEEIILIEDEYSENEESAALEADTETDEAVPEIEVPEPEPDHGLQSVDYEPSSMEHELKGKVLQNGVIEEFTDLTEGEDYASNELVTFAASEEEAKEIAEIYGGSLKSYANFVAIIDMTASEYSVEEAFRYSLSEDYSLPFVEPNYRTTIEEPQETSDDEPSDGEFLSNYLPSENAFSDRWWLDEYRDELLNPDNKPNQWHHKVINTYSAWGVTTGNSGIVVGVLDSGINPSHSDFTDNITIFKDAAKDINNQSDMPGANELIDPVGHGTHVAGIIGAALNDHLGAGVAPNVTLLPIRVSDETGNVDQDLLYKALIYVGDLKFTGNGFVSEGNIKADVINISIGFQYYSACMEVLFNGVHDAGVTAVVSMGNTLSNRRQYPASLDTVIAVCSTNETGQLSSFSSFGNWADISAPGSHILSCDSKSTDSYVSMGGTSMATPVVAGACALYMSAVGHVDPDTMKRVIQSSVTGIAGANTGAGIIDLAKMFKGDTTAPCITLKANDGTFIGEVKDGAKYTIPYGVATDSYLSFTPRNFGGDAEGNANTKIIYTIDGTTPSVSNGVMTNGIVVEKNTDGSNKPVIIMGLGLNNEKPIKLTVKAIAVTGMGVTSKVSTLIFSIDPELNIKSEELDDGLAVQITNAPQSIVAGKSYVFKALVTKTDPYAAVSQKVTWRIESYSGGDLSKCKINASNGTLTTVAGKSGTIVISCTTADSRETATKTIKITGDFPVKTIALLIGEEEAPKKEANLQMKLNAEKTALEGTSALIWISKLLDTKDHNLLDTSEENTYTFEDKTIEWSSSNENVAVVVPETEYSGPCATVTAVGAGNAVITCKVLDGSGKSAKMNVKITSEAMASSVSIRNAENPTEAITALTTNTGVGSISLTSLIEYADGSEDLSEPIWTTSNKNIVVVNGSGKDATIIPRAKGTAKITCAATDGSGKKAVLTVTVLQYVTSIEIVGQKYISKGGSCTYTAKVLPASANNKSVRWEIVYKPWDANITIDAAKGKVTVKNDDTISDGDLVMIRAVAKDGGAVESAVYTIEVKSKATKVTATVADGYKTTIATEGKGEVNNLTMIVCEADNNTKLAFSSSNPKVAKVEVMANTATVKAVSKGTAKITVAAQDGSGKKAVVNINVVQLLDSVKVTGQSNIARGNKATFKASVYPASANNKGVNWILWDEGHNVVSPESGVTINNGVVSVAANATVGETYYVVTTPKDGGMVDCEMASFTVTDVKATSVKVEAYGNSVIQRVHNIPEENKVVSALRLYDTDIPDSMNRFENKITLQGYAYHTTKAGTTDITDAVDLLWSSSNNKIVTVNGYDDGSATVKALKAGTANITCAANDGSGKKATVKVTVITPASGIDLTGAKGLSEFIDRTAYLAAGSASATVAKVGNAYGKPSVAKVKWDSDYGVSLYNYVNGEYYEITDPELLKEIKQKKVFGSAANGKVTASANKGFEDRLIKYFEEIVGVDYDDSFDYYGKEYKYGAVVRPMITVTARTTDGTGYSESFSYYIVKATTKLSFKQYIRTTENSEGQLVTTIGPAISRGVCTIECEASEFRTRNFRVAIDADGFVGLFTAVSSNPKVATVIPNGNNILIYPEGKGTTKVTLTAQDGTNKKATITIKVIEKKP